MRRVRTRRERTCARSYTSPEMFAVELEPFAAPWRSGAVSERRHAAINMKNISRGDAEMRSK